MGDITKVAFTVNKKTLASSDIELKLLDGDSQTALPEFVEADGTYKIKINVTDGKLLKDVGYNTVTAEGATCTFDKDSNVATLTVARGNDDVLVKLTITNGTTPYVMNVFTVKKQEQQFGNQTPTDPANNPDISLGQNFYSALFKGVNPAITQGARRVYGTTYTGSALLGTSYAESENNEQLELNEQIQAVSAGEKVTQSSVTAKTTDAPVSIETSTLTSAKDSASVTTAPAARVVSAYEEAADTQTVEAVSTVPAENTSVASEIEPTQHSAAAIIVVLIALFAAVSGIWVGCKKRRILV